MIQTINNWVNEEERKTLVDFIISNDEKNKKLGPDQLLSTSQPGELRSSTYMLKDSLTDRWKEFNFLSEPIVNKILAPKFISLVGESYVTLWANIFRKGEYIAPHHHHKENKYTVSGNIFLSGPKDIGICFACGKREIEHGTLLYFPATTIHWVDENPYDEMRISMGFDVHFKNVERAIHLVPERKNVMKAAW